MAKKPKNSGLSEFFDESVLGNAISVMKSNANFAATDNGVPVYLCVRLDTAAIGGIDKKTKNDKSVGGVIEQVRGGLIDAYVTAETNENNQLVFIPTMKTLNGMADFSKFTKPEWELVKVTEEGTITGTGMMITYPDMLAIVKGQKSLADFLTNLVQERQAQERAAAQAEAEKAAQAAAQQAAQTPAQARAAEAAQVAADAEAAVQQLQNFGPGAPGGGINLEDAGDFGGFGDFVDESMFQQPQQQFAGQQPVYDDQQPEPQYVVTQDAVMEALTRTFFADDLNLVVSTEAFDQALLVRNNPLQFALNETQGFVDGALNQKAIAMNQALLQKHSMNLMLARQQYLNLMSKRVAAIQEQLDMEDSATEWGARKRALEAERDSRLASAEQIIDKRKADLERSFKEAMESEAETAAQAARSRYKQRFQKQHDDDMFSIDAKVKSEIQSEFTEKLRRLHEERRTRAMSLMDLNADGAMSEITETYRAMFEEESRMYADFSKELDTYVEGLHIESSQRNAVEEERLRQTNMANQVRDEMNARLTTMQEEFKARIAALEAERDTAVRTAAESVQLIKQQKEEERQLAEQRERGLQEQLDKAIVRFQEAEENVKRDYQHRMQQASDERDSWKQTLEAYRAQHKHNNRITAILIIAIVAACLAGGFIAGNLFNQSKIENGISVTVKDIDPDGDGEVKQEDLDKLQSDDSAAPAENAESSAE